jgi:isopenicillin N synthase-like dioxygenase
MASEKLFEAIPSFPDHVPVSPMYTVSLAQLHAQDASAARNMLHACQELGFFLLDLRHDPLGEDVIGEVDALFTAGKDIMNLPDEIKKQFQHDFPKSTLGYVVGHTSATCCLDI